MGAPTTPGAETRNPGGGGGGGGPIDKKPEYDLQALRISLISDEFARRRAEQARYYKDELKKIDAGVRKIVAEAADFAMMDKEPDPSELYTDVLA